MKHGMPRATPIGLHLVVGLSVLAASCQNSGSDASTPAADDSPAASHDVAAIASVFDGMGPVARRENRDPGFSAPRGGSRGP